MKRAMASKGDATFVNMMVILVQNFGIDHEEVMDMPYSRARVFLDFLAEANKKKPGTLGKGKTLGM